LKRAIENTIANSGGPNAMKEGNSAEKPVAKKPKRSMNSQKRGDNFNVVDPNEAKKNEVITELKETIEILEQKVNKMEMLAKLKDDKINILSEKINKAQNQL